MLKNIAGTFIFKLGAALLNFLVVLLVSCYLGATGKGETSLLIANITIILLFTGILGGTALIYLTPRHNIYQLLVPAYAAAIIWCTTITFLWQYLKLITDGVHLWGLSLLHALFTINAMVLLGKKQVDRYNILTLLQPFLLALVLLAAFLLFDVRKTHIFVHGLYLSYGTFFLVSLYYIWQLPDKLSWHESGLTLKALLNYGTTAQLANIFAFINNRISFYLLNYFIAVKAVGIYSVGVALAEGLWLMGRSIALVQYTRIANSSDKDLASKETIKLARMSLYLTLVGLLILLSLPTSFYIYLFGKEFGEVRRVILFLSLGIASVSLGNIFIHYFSGLGKYGFNTAAAIIGLLFTVPGSWFLVEKYGLVGAALGASLGHFISTIYLSISFQREANISLFKLLPQAEDLDSMIRKFKA